jgi:hypothetical protein
MAMRRETGVQDDLVATWSEMPRSPGHAFYDRLQALLKEAGFDAFVEEVCKPYYAPRMGAPSLPPGRYFRSKADAHARRRVTIPSLRLAHLDRADPRLDRASRIMPVEGARGAAHGCSKHCYPALRGARCSIRSSRQYAHASLVEALYDAVWDDVMRDLRGLQARVQ